MTTPAQLRAAITGLIGLAATEEEMLLAGEPRGELGSPGRWAGGEEGVVDGFVSIREAAGILRLVHH